MATPPRANVNAGRGSEAGPRRRLAALALLLIAAAPALGGIPWWNTAWRCRRVVHIKGFLGPEVGAFYFEFYNGGLTREDGRDIRVVAGGRVVPHWLVWHTPGGVTRVAAQYVRGARLCAIYYGNPRAPQPEGDWTPRGGLWLETRPYRRGFPTDERKLKRELAATADNVYGRGLVEQIYHGHNPYGPSGYSLSIYRGTLDVKKAGRYALASNATEASFLYLDDRLIQKWAGWSWARNRARGVKKLKLRAGLHPIRFYSFAVRWRQISVVAWLPPGAKRKRFEVIPASAFLPIARARQWSYEIRGEKVAPDFSFENVDEAHTDFTILVRCRFRNTTALPRGTRVRCRWSFGDGLSAEGEDVTHVYFRSADRKVTMTLHVDGRKWTVTHVVPATQNWARQSDRKLWPDRKAYGRTVQAYDFAKLDTRDLLIAIRVFGWHGWPDATQDLHRALEAVIARAGKLRSSDRIEASDLVGDAYEKRDRPTPLAIEAFKRLEAAGGPDAVKGRIGVDMAEYYLHFKMFENAERAAEAALKLKPIAVDTRRARVILGDVAFTKGDVKAARAQYEQAEAIKVAKRTQARERVRVGAFTRIIEDYIRQNRQDAALEILDRLEWEIPTVRLDGYNKILRGKILWGLKKPNEAVTMLERLVATNPKNAFADDALLLAARIHLDQRPPRRKEAAADLKKLLKDYPESANVNEAKALLAQAGG